MCSISESWDEMGHILIYKNLLNTTTEGVVKEDFGNGRPRTEYTIEIMKDTDKRESTKA